MGEPAVDTSDPMSSQPSADDLLSQLAGEEIDRLLAEADVAKEPIGVGEKPLSPPEPVLAATVDSTLENQLDDLFNELQSPAGAAPKPTAELAVAKESPATAESPVIAELPAAAEPLPAKEPAKAPPVTVADLPHDATEDARLRVLASELELDQHSLPAPLKTEVLAKTTPADEDVLGEDDPTADPGSAPLPFFLRPLEWINAPLNSRPDWIRAAVGKVAIVTLLNAVAALAWVMFVRKHH